MFCRYDLVVILHPDFCWEMEVQTACCSVRLLWNFLNHSYISSTTLLLLNIIIPSYWYIPLFILGKIGQTLWWKCKKQPVQKCPRVCNHQWLTIVPDLSLHGNHITFHQSRSGCISSPSIWAPDTAWLFLSIL